MKKTLFVAASALSMIAAPAFAQSASTDIQLGATVAKACGLGNHLSGAATGAGDQSDISIPSLSDGNGQFNTALNFNRSFGNVWCNGAATVTIGATPLSTAATTTDTGSFSNTFDLEVSGGAMVYTGGGSVTTAGAAASKSGNTGGAFETGLGTYSSVDIKVLPSMAGTRAKRPVAGTYAGSVTITATAL